MKFKILTELDRTVFLPASSSNIFTISKHPSAQAYASGLQCFMSLQRIFALLFINKRTMSASECEAAVCKALISCWSSA